MEVMAIMLSLKALEDVFENCFYGLGHGNGGYQIS